MDTLEATGNDLKAGIDDLIHEIKKNRNEIREIKLKLGMIKNSNHTNNNNEVKQASWANL